MKNPDAIAKPEIAEYPGETRAQRRDRHEREHAEYEAGWAALTPEQYMERRRRIVHRGDALIRGIWYHERPDPEVPGDSAIEVWQECSCRSVLRGHARDLHTTPHWTCGCGMGFLDDEVTDIAVDKAKAPKHMVRRTMHERVQYRVENAIKALGLDPHEDGIREAVWAVRDAYGKQRTPTDLSLMADAMQVLATQMTRRAAVEQTAKAIADFEGLKIGDEFAGFPDSTLYGFEGEEESRKGDAEAPFFTEGFLYSLVGKGAARTVLAYWAAVKQAAGS